MQLLAESSSKKSYRIVIEGVVQGVGFRPFVFQLAKEYGLCGYVTNSGSGVVVAVEGTPEHIDSFLVMLQQKKPPLARIDKIEKESTLPLNLEDFRIVDSLKSTVSTMLLADMSLCNDCLEEMQDKENRRYNYPFINCTNCGPRYSIIKNLPYDRKMSSMDSFAMCEKCQEEYHNPNDRRYHAQPISCYECGPSLKYVTLSGEEEHDQKKALEKIATLIKAGEVVAIKGVGGFHIVCDATNSEAVRSLRENKHRPTKPLAVMFKSLQAIKKVASMSKKEETLILSKERPITIVKKREHTTLSHLIAPNIDRIGVFLPYTPLHVLLLKKVKVPLVATSANLSGEPIIVDEKEIFQKMPFVVEHLLTYDREIVNACDDSVVQESKHHTITLRMARGYAPFSLYYKQKTAKKILAFGANQKVTIALAFENNILLSPHIGDIDSISSSEYFQKTLETLQRVYKFEPDIVVCDKHPKYETSRFARAYADEHAGVELVELQHHYAHALSCMSEYSLDEDVLAFCFDGTGYGDDGKLWGGEVFVANTKKYERVYHFKELALLGGEVAIKEPRRVGLSMLFASFSLETILQMDSPLVNAFKESEIRTLYSMYERGINSPQSSSVGRLFDGVYALSGFTQSLGYEGESGLILESLSEKSKSKAIFKYFLQEGVVEYAPMIAEILEEPSKEKIAKKFMNTLVHMILTIAEKYPELPLVLSGGVFQNRVLVSMLTQKLREKKRAYYIPSSVAINDGGIALGQAYFAFKNSKG